MQYIFISQFNLQSINKKVENRTKNITSGNEPSSYRIETLKICKIVIIKYNKYNPLVVAILMSNVTFFKMRPQVGINAACMICHMKY